MEYTINLLDRIRHRYISHAVLKNYNSTEMVDAIPALVDTGAFNTMIDIALAKRFGFILPMSIPISIGGNHGEAQGCIVHRLTVGDFTMSRIFALAYPFKDWLAGYIIIGTNVLNNWDFTISRVDNLIRLSERIPEDAPNKAHPYQNYFTEGEYVAVQDEMIDAVS